MAGHIRATASRQAEAISKCVTSNFIRDRDTFQGESLRLAPAKPPRHRRVGPAFCRPPPIGHADDRGLAHSKLMRPDRSIISL